MLNDKEHRKTGPMLGPVPFGMVAVRATSPVGPTTDVRDGSHTTIESPQLAALPIQGNSRGPLPARPRLRNRRPDASKILIDDGPASATNTRPADVRDAA